MEPTFIDNNCYLFIYLFASVIGPGTLEHLESMQHIANIAKAMDWVIVEYSSVVHQIQWGSWICQVLSQKRQDSMDQISKLVGKATWPGHARTGRWLCTLLEASSSRGYDGLIGFDT